jgi:putative transcriptional regulator
VDQGWPGAARPYPQGHGADAHLDGAFNDERGRFGPGDISVADETIDHRPVAEKDRPCIAFSVLDAPVKADRFVPPADRRPDRLKAATIA